MKLTLLLNWRSEIAHLYEGRPLNVVTRGLNEAVYRYSLRCDDFLAIIDGVEMEVRTDIRAPSLEQLDRYCECVAAAVGRLLAERAKAAGVEQVVFDRAGYRYHGRIKSLADAAREAGLQF